MKKLIVSVFLLFCSLTAIAAIPDALVSFIWDEEPVSVEKGKDVSTKISLSIPEGFYIYAEKADLEFVTLEGIQVTDIKYPKKQFIPDPLGGEPVGVYISGEVVEVRMSVPDDLADGIYNVSALFHYQACSEKFCLRPTEKLISWTINVGDVSAEMASSDRFEGVGSGLAGFLDLIRGKSSETVLTIKLKWLYLIAFLGGILSCLTPCILPLIPVTMLIIGVHPKRNWKGNLGLSFTLVLGMSITYAALGIVAAVMGMSLGFIFQSRLFIVFVVVVFFFLGLSLLGLYTIQLPAGIRNALTKLGGSGYRGAFLTGISMGLLATPCVGPVLGALLIYAASARSLSISFSLLMAYSIGLGLMIIVIGTWYGTIVSGLKKARVKWVKKLIGILLLATSLYYLHSLVPYTALFMKRAEHPIRWQAPQHAMVQVAERTPIPKMVLFSANWCPPCKFLDIFALRNVEVVDLSKKFINISIDMTYASRENKALADKYDIKGWPTIVFVSPEGMEFGDLRIFGGYISAKSLAEHMKEALARSGEDSGT